MKRFTLYLTFGIIILALSGCMNISVEVWHNPDGSGRILHQQAFTEAFFAEFGLKDDLEEAKIEFLEETELTHEHLPEGPNIKRITADTYFDSESNDLVTFFDMDVYDIVGFTTLDNQPAGASDYYIIIEDNQDGTFHFFQYLNFSIEELSTTSEPSADENIRQVLLGQNYTLRLHAQEMVEGDTFANFDSTAGVITWEIPMADVLLATSPIELFAIYRVETSHLTEKTESENDEVLVPEVIELENSNQIGMLEGLPVLVLYALAGLYCLTMIAVVVAVVVILVIKK